MVTCVFFVDEYLLPGLPFCHPPSSSVFLHCRGRIKLKIQRCEQIEGYLLEIKKRCCKGSINITVNVGISPMQELYQNNLDVTL